MAHCAFVLSYTNVCGIQILTASFLVLQKYYRGSFKNVNLTYIEQTNSKLITRFVNTINYDIVSELRAAVLISEFTVYFLKTLTTKTRIVPTLRAGYYTND